MLSMECRKAFEFAGLVDNIQPQIKKAVDLCSLYAGSSSTRSILDRDASSNVIGALWQDTAEHQTAIDKKQLATSVLGNSLVDALVEENRQPPDVSLLITE